ncbi:MAG TPA: chemotaxis protein CheD [Anaerolineae bacterium]|nr:chemotaxis protein CheD [Anaerolineae bacterium]
MTERVVAVEPGKLVVSGEPDDILVAFGLGSCVAVAAYDPVTKVAGLLHAVLPRQRDGSNNHSRFVDKGILLMVEQMERSGASRIRLRCWIVGGARMMLTSNGGNVFNIGQENVQTALQVLRREQLRLVASEVGGKVGRTIKLHVNDGRVTVRQAGGKERLLISDKG